MDLDFLLCLRLVGRAARRTAGALLRRGAGDHDLRQMILRLDQVELGLVGVVVVGDLGVGDVDLRLDLLVQQLGLGQPAADLALQVVEGQVRAA